MVTLGGMKYPDKPFLPSDIRRDTGRTLVRAATAMLLSKHKGQPIKDIIAKNWPGNDRELIQRAATLPANSTTQGWASDLVGMVAADAVGVFAPASASAAIFARGSQFKFDGAGAIAIPNFSASASNIDFISEGSPIPVIQHSTSSQTIL